MSSMTCSRRWKASARAARKRSKARIIAVTGSVGKTSTKEMLRKVLSDAGPTHASDKSYNNHWGVPLTLARLPESARFAVFEIGMNHAGEIAPLVDMVRPHVAVVTNVAPVHLEHFSGVEAIAARQGRDFLRARQGRRRHHQPRYRDIPDFARRRPRHRPPAMC